MAGAVWLLSCAAALLALRWNLASGPRKLRTALISSGLALAIGYYGISKFQLAASKTVNGHVVYSINSKWFFLAALLLGAGALVLTLLNWRKASLPLAPDALINPPPSR